jgi:hypothetical protein
VEKKIPALLVDGNASKKAFATARKCGVSLLFLKDFHINENNLTLQKESSRSGSKAN